MIIKQGSLFLVWKNAGIASTYGNEESVISMIEKGVVIGRKSFDSNGFSEKISAGIKKYSGTEIIDEDAFIEHQSTIFSHKEEFGLLNRLDTPTAGMLYFAGDIDTYRQRSDQQKNDRIKKHYYAVVEGNIGNYFTYGSKNDDVIVTDDTITISRPLMHHIDDERKMIAPVEQSGMKKGRGSVLHCSSEISLVEYNEEENCSLIHVVIHRGRRHQIRVHCASLGHPLVGDVLYSKKVKQSGSLHLWSVGVALV